MKVFSHHLNCSQALELQQLIANYFDNLFKLCKKKKKNL